MYRVGRPGWKVFGRFGATLVYRVDVMHDAEAGVYIATSRDVPGLVAEAPNFDELFREVQAGAEELLADQLHQRRHGSLMGAWPNHDCLAPA